MSTPTEADVRQRLQALARQRGAPGLQYLVVRRGEAWLEQCLGEADHALQRGVTPQTRFNAYSITKPFTAAAVLTLAAQGRLDLEQPIGQAAGVEGLQAYGSVRQALLHRAGLRNPNPLRWFHLAEAHAQFDEAAFVDAQLAALKGSRRRWARSGYSNIGYLLLGRVIQRCTGSGFVPAVQALLLDRLGLAADDHLGFEITAPGLHAHGHLRRHGFADLVLGLLVDRSAIVQSVDGPWVRLRLHHLNGSAYGGLMASARGLARFGPWALGACGALPQAVQDGLLSDVPGPGLPRSLAWFSGQLGGRRWLAHAGGGLGAYGELRVYPELSAVSVLLSNGAGFSDARCLDRIDTAWLPAKGR